MDNNIRDILDNYTNILDTNYNSSQLDKYELFEESCKKKVLNGESVNLNEEARKLGDADILSINETLNSCRDAIKNYYLENDKSLYHITNLAPENISGGVLNLSKNRDDCYMLEREDSFFASSKEADGNNFYLGRSPKYPSTYCNNSFVYGGDNLNLSFNEKGSRKLELKEPNYVYEINPESFTPVINFSRDRDDNSCISFSDEWKSKKMLDINNQNDIKDIKEVKDVSSLLDGHNVYQVSNLDIFKDIGRQNRDNREEYLKTLADRGEIDDMSRTFPKEISIPIGEIDNKTNTFKENKNLEEAFKNISEEFVNNSSMKKERDNEKTYNISLYEEPKLEKIQEKETSYDLEL